jgi:beta-glucosidase-like glycosyl hydrolase
MRLPAVTTLHTFGAPLLEAIRDGIVDEALVDRALRRVLSQKVKLGLLDASWSSTPEVLRGVDTSNSESLRSHIDLDGPENRAIARELAEQSIVLLSNDGTLPLAAPARVAVIGPNAEAPLAVLGCYASSLDPTAAFPFGHGIGYSRFEWSAVGPAHLSMAVDGSVTLSLRVTNASERDGVEVVQLYVSDPVASIVRPVQRLIAYRRVELVAGQSELLSVSVPADLASFTGRSGKRIVAPGERALHATWV